MAKNEHELFRKKAMDKVSSPEQLSDYLRVTNPGIWVILIAVISLLVGLFAWAAVGTIETKEAVKVVIKDYTAQVVSSDSEALQQGMSLTISGEETSIAYVEEDEFGRNIGVANIHLPDGEYEGTVVTEEVRPINFLFKSW